MAEASIISFDIGGTLLNADRGGFCTQLCAMIGCRVEELRPLLVKYFLTRNGTMHESVRAFCAEARLGDADELVARYVPPRVCVFADAAPVLTALREEGHRLIALSNCTPWESGDLDRLGLTEFLHRTFHSFELGFAKPDARIFRAVEAALGVPPTSFTHIGDSPIADILGAQSCGWTAVALCRESRLADACERTGARVVRSLAELPAMLAASR